MSSDQSSRRPSNSSSRAIHAPRPIRPVPVNNLSNSAKTIVLPPDVLDDAQEIDGTPQLPQLQPGQQYAKVEVINDDGEPETMYVIVKPRHPGPPSSIAHPGSAAYYDDCVSDYSHEQSRPSPPPQSTSPQAPQPARQQRQHQPPHSLQRPEASRLPCPSPSQRKLMDDDPAEYRRQNAMKGLQVSHAAGAPSIPFRSDQSVIMMSLMGELFSVLKVYAVRAAKRCQDFQFQVPVSKLKAKQTVIKARLISFGKQVLSEIENARQPSSRPIQKSDFYVKPMHNSIDPSIPVLPVEDALARDQARQALYSLNQKATAPGDVTRKPLVQRQKVASPQASKSTPRHQVKRKPVNQASGSHSMRGSLAVASGGESTGSSRSATPSSGRWTPREASTLASSQYANPDDDPFALRKVPWADW